MSEPRIEWRPWSGLEALYLGEIIVGRVAAAGGGRGGGKARAVFNLEAVEYVASWFTCQSAEEAKAEVERRLDLWLERAGLQ